MRNFQFFLLFSITLLAGCASNNNFRTGSNHLLGGGFLDQEIKPGLYKLSAKANESLWPSFEAARETWKRRADQLCGKDSYQEIITTQNEGLRRHDIVYEPTILNPVIPTFNTLISGYVLCSSSVMSRDDAIKFLEELPANEAKELSLRRKSELNDLGGSDCSEKEVGKSADIYFRRGKILMDQNEYKAAMSCFMIAQSMESDTSAYRDSCSEIGMMYELGWGVEKDIPVSKTWYKKAGL